MTTACLFAVYDNCDSSHNDSRVMSQNVTITHFTLYIYSYNSIWSICRVSKLLSHLLVGNHSNYKLTT